MGHVSHPFVEIPEMRGEHVVTIGDVTVEERVDLLQAHPRTLTADDDRNPGHVDLTESSPSGTVADGVEQPGVLPVAEHMGAEPEVGGESADRPRESV